MIHEYIEDADILHSSLITAHMSGSSVDVALIGHEGGPNQALCPFNWP